ncbi:MAG: zf-HC2 domain-containing protein [Phycisphaerales bacterium]
MCPHNVSDEQLVQFVLGELPPERIREMEAHLCQCEPCRQAIGRLQSLLDCAECMGKLPEDDKIVESANRAVLLAAKTQDQSRRSGVSRAALFGRTIMNHRMAKWAVAAVVALAVIAGLSLLPGGGTGKVYARMVDQLRGAHTLTFSLISVTGVESMPTVRLEMAYRDTGHFRSATPDGYITVLETADTGVKGISFVPATKTYVVFEMTNVPDDAAKDPWVTVERLRTLPTQADRVLGSKEIDGRMLDGFEVREDDATTRVWIDPRTGQLVRAEVGFAAAPGMNMILSDFQFDAPLEDSFFSLEPPEGYTPVEVSADVSQVAERDFVEFLRLWSNWTVDASFPPTVNGPDIARIAVQMARERKFVGPYAPAYGAECQPQVMYQGMVFIGRLPGGTWRYAGQNVSFGDPATPIFWYQPEGSPTCRVIYADLHVADVAPQDLPK